jgi:hypothetical protein
MFMLRTMPELSHRPSRVDVSADQLATWRGRKVGTSVRLSGQCPACRHDMSVTVSLRVTALESSDEEPAQALTAAFQCECAKVHKGQPDAPKGCGRTWTATAWVAAGDSVKLTPVDDPYLAQAARALLESQSGQLNRLQSAAEKWITGIGALTGLFGVIGLGLASEGIRALTTPGRTVIAVATVVAGLAAAAAILLAYGAAYGWPRTHSVENDNELKSWYADQADEAIRIGSRLRSAAIAGCVALVILLVAASFVWVFPSADAEGPLTRVSMTDQSVRCGRLLLSGSEGVIRIRRADNGAAETLQVRDISQIDPVEKC